MRLGEQRHSWAAVMSVGECRSGGPWAHGAGPPYLPFLCLKALWTDGGRRRDCESEGAGGAVFESLLR